MNQGRYVLLVRGYQELQTSCFLIQSVQSRGTRVPGRSSQFLDRVRQLLHQYLIRVRPPKYEEVLFYPHRLDQGLQRESLYR